MLFMTAKNRKQLRCLSADEQINTMWFAHTMEYDLSAAGWSTDSYGNIGEAWKQAEKISYQNTPMLPYDSIRIKTHTCGMIPLVWIVQTRQIHRDRK